MAHRQQARDAHGMVDRILGACAAAPQRHHGDAHIARLQEKMKAAAANLDFEKAAALRDDIKRLRNADLGLPWPARRH